MPSTARVNIITLIIIIGIIIIITTTILITDIIFQFSVISSIIVITIVTIIITIINTRSGGPLKLLRSGGGRIPPPLRSQKLMIRSECNTYQMIELNETIPKHPSVLKFEVK